MTFSFFSLCKRIASCAAIAVVATMASFAEAAKMYAFQYAPAGGALHRFDSTNPGSSSSVPISGLASNEYVGDIAVRPATGQLYAVLINLSSGKLRVGVIDPFTGFTRIVTAAGAEVSLANGSIEGFFGMSFDAITDHIRVVSDAGFNRRLNPNTGGLIAEDKRLSDAAAKVVHMTITSPYVGAPLTTAIGIDSLTNSLVRIGGDGGIPFPSDGALTVIGSLGVDVGNFGGMAVHPSSEAIYAALDVGGFSYLYRIDARTGRATLVGPLSVPQIDGIAFAPPDRCLDVDGDGRVSATTDGLILVRALLGMTGTAVTTSAGVFGAAPRNNWNSIRTHLNVECGMDFAP